MKAAVSRKQQVGLSLIELMVSITIGLIILAAVAQLFLTSNQTYKSDEGLSRIQEAGRMTMEFITKDIRMAGNTGCLRRVTAPKNNLKNPTSYAINFVADQQINGHHYIGPGTATTAWSPSLPTGSGYFASGDVLPNTDVLVIRRMSETSVKLKTAMTTTSDPLTIENNPTGLSVGDIVMVANCERGDLFQITGPATFTDSGNNIITHTTGVGTPGNNVATVSSAYDNNAEIMKLMTTVYYLGRRNNNAAAPPTLFRKELSAGTTVTQELVEGVENMVIFYGEDVDSDGIADTYKRADEVTNFSRVVSVRLGLLIRTIDRTDATVDNKTFSVAGVSIGPANDKYRRQAFTTTVMLRNP